MDVNKNEEGEIVITLDRPRGVQLPAVVKNLDRSLAALEMRKQGYSHRQIALALNYKYASMVQRDIKHALKYVLREPAEAVRRIELDRLDTMLTVLWPRVLAGNLNAMDRVLRIMEKRSKLLGIDAPPKTPIESKNTAGIRIIESAEATSMLKDGTLFADPDMGEYDPQFSFNDGEEGEIDSTLSSIPQIQQLESVSNIGNQDSSPISDEDWDDVD